MSEFRKIGRREIDLILAHAVRSPKVMQVAIDKIAVDDFDSVAERPHKLIWAVASDFYRTYKSLPTFDHLLAEVSRRTKDSSDFSVPEFIDEVCTLLVELYEGIKPESILPDYAFELMKDFIFDRQVYTKGRDMFEKGIRDQGAFEELANINLQGKIASANLVNPFSGDLLLGVKRREPIGVDFLDVMLGGGPRAGELYGFCAPSGGGKTTLTNQIGLAAADNKRSFVIFTYEQPPDQEYMIPVYAAAAKIPRHVIESITKPEDIRDERMRNSLMAAKERLSHYIIYADMSGTYNRSGSGGPLEIDRMLQQLKEQGVDIYGFAVDWFLPMAQRYRINYDPGKSRKNVEDRIFYQGCCEQLKQIAKKNGVWGWVTHQLTAASIAKKGRKEQTDSAEFKSFPWYMDATFHMGRLHDEDRTAEIAMTKGRSFVGGQGRVVKLLGDIATFVPLGDDFVVDSTNGKAVKQGRDKVIPRDEHSAPMPGQQPPSLGDR